MLRLKIKPQSAKIPTQLGFTLIELLVVISLISLLSSIILVATVKARQRSVDSVIYASMANLQKATELYFQDNNAYPTAVLDTDYSDNSNWQTELGPQLKPYLPQMPASAYKGSVTLNVGFGNTIFDVGPYVYFRLPTSSPAYGVYLLDNKGNVTNVLCFYHDSYAFGVWTQAQESFQNFYGSIGGRFANYIVYGGNIKMFAPSGTCL